jgi:predicted RNase H-like HicB family nuclease
MVTARYVYWQDGKQWVGYFEEFPDYLTQGDTLDDLQEHLKELYLDLTGGQIPGIRRVGELSFSS